MDAYYNEDCNLKRWRKYTGTCIYNKSISALCAETSKTMQQCYDFAVRHKRTIIRIKQALNNTGSTVGIAWVAVCWGVMVCIRVGHADGSDCYPSRHPRLSNCTPSHPKHGILIFSASKNLI